MSTERHFIIGRIDTRAGATQRDTFSRHYATREEAEAKATRYAQGTHREAVFVVYQAVSSIERPPVPVLVTPL